MMGEIDLEAAASRVSSTSSPWEALEGLRTALQHVEAGLAAVASAEGDGLVKAGTFEKVGQDIVASVAGSRAGLSAISREVDRILQSAAATARGKRRGPSCLEDVTNITAGT